MVLKVVEWLHLLQTRTPEEQTEKLFLLIIDANQIPNTDFSIIISRDLVLNIALEKKLTKK